MRITHELGVTSHQAADGTEYQADDEGYIDVPDEVAKDLLRRPGWSVAGAASAPEAPAEAPPAPSGSGEGSEGESGAQEGAGGDPGEGQVVDLESLDREALDALAAEHGVEVGARWGDKRVRETLRKAGVIGAGTVSA